ncbi:hypothetical protein BKA70DRAFT_1440751 [Coprinopsis sp. MPI-PUGE-AT-0042]|nr:hypothetical protein BKA70DRAFT_1440751 [Coprinopsis sp. MPI-PUGE-AT-0042]
MHNFKDIHPKRPKAFSRRTGRSAHSAQEFISEADTGAETVADFEGWISRHYEGADTTASSDRRVLARLYVHSLCLYDAPLTPSRTSFVAFARGLPTNPRPWLTSGSLPTANFPVLVARSNLQNHMFAVLRRLALREDLGRILDIWAAHSPEYAVAKGYTLVAPPTTSTTAPNVPAQTSQAPPATPAPNPTIAPAVQTPSLISMDAVEEGSARTKPSKGKNREVIDLSGGATSGSVPSTSKAPAPSVPPPTGNFGGVVLETPRPGSALVSKPETSRTTVRSPEDLDARAEASSTPSSSKVVPTSSPSTAPSSPTSQLSRAPMPAAAARGAAAPSASQPSAPVAATNAPAAAAAPAGSSAISAAIPHGGVPDFFLRLLPGKPWAKYLGAAITPPCGRCAISGAGGRSSRAEDLGPCIAPGPGQPCNHCTRDKQKCTFTLPTEDRNIVANNAYLAGTMSPAAIVEGAERVARHAQLFALMEQTAYAMAAEGLAEQRKFLSNLRRAEHMMGKEAVIEQLFGSEELYEEYQEHFAHAFDDERPLPNLPLVDVAWFAQELLDVQGATYSCSTTDGGGRGVGSSSPGGSRAPPRRYVRRRCHCRTCSRSASEPSSVSAPSVAAPASAGLGALAEYADSPESPPNSDQEMDTSK